MDHKLKAMCPTQLRSGSSLQIAVNIRNLQIISSRYYLKRGVLSAAADNLYCRRIPVPL
jgi:hypothetical protein